MSPRTMRLTFAFAVVATASLALVQLASARIDGPANAAATTIQAGDALFFFTFKPTTKSIAKLGKVTLAFENVGHMEHDFRIDGTQTALVQPGKAANLVVTFKRRASTPPLRVPGHAAAGMKGVSTAR
jgi:uncharacterized cupredoxin-like copper-binding protein